jgi:arylformamidase
MKRIFFALTLAAFGAVLMSLSNSAHAASPDTSTTWQIQRDFPYGNDPAQAMDIYYRSGLHGAPIILMVHGGGWARGDKAATNVVVNKVNHWVPRGYIFISINYRLLPAANPLEQANDVALAIAVAQRNAAYWGGDPTRLILMGHSAGGHLAALLASDPTIAAQAGAAPWKGTICLDSAGYDLVQLMQGPHLPLYDEAFGSNPDFWKNASPFYRLIGTPQPVLAVFSARRPGAALQTMDYIKKIQAVGARGAALPERLSHEDIDRNLGRPGDYTRRVDRFIESLISSRTS